MTATWYKTAPGIRMTEPGFPPGGGGPQSSTRDRAGSNPGSQPTGAASAPAAGRSHSPKIAPARSPAAKLLQAIAKPKTPVICHSERSEESSNINKF